MNADRLIKDIETLAKIGATADGGVSRLAYSEQDREGRELVSGWMAAAGLSVHTDSAGNIIGRKEGGSDRPAIAIGSHIDTVPEAGRYDGTLGVLGGIECLRAIDDAGVEHRHPLELIVFANEEGARNTGWLFGSRAMAGLLDDGELDRPDDERIPPRDRVASFLGNAEPIEKARRATEEFRAYLELHVEQGPLLEKMKCPIGIVEGISGRTSLVATVVGMANHAGTTPMDYRSDALVAAAHLIVEIRRLVAEEGMTRVGTVGQIQNEPNALNIVPGRARLAMEFRDLSAEALSAVPERVRSLAASVAEKTRTKIEIEHQSTTEAVPSSEAIRKAIDRSAAVCGLPTHRMPSGAGHDALSMAHLTEMGMIFVPSAGGVSHAPQEFTSKEACANGANVLLNTLVELDQN